MGRRGRKAEWYSAAAEPTAAREELERRWRGRMVREPRLAAMVTADGAALEPFHRWMHYRQGFSPALVRLFLSEQAEIRPVFGKQPLLDPFSGSGTTVIEATRLGVKAVGVEAISSLAFLTAVRAERSFPAFPGMSGDEPWEVIADRLTLPIQKAALMVAVGRQHTSDGHLNKAAAPLSRLLEQVGLMIREDIGHPLSLAATVVCADSRDLDCFSDESMGGILTSPPYLSRYDYREVCRPYEMVYARWSDSRSDDSSTHHAAHHAAQLPANASPSVAMSKRGRRTQVTLPSSGQFLMPNESSLGQVIAESSRALEAAGQAGLAGLVETYVTGLADALGACHRVLRSGSPCWFVVGGARMKGVYVPSDLIFAELAEHMGFVVESLRVARDLIHGRRKFGKIGHISPRETVVVMYKSK